MNNKRKSNTTFGSCSGGCHYAYTMWRWTRKKRGIVFSVRFMYL